MYVLYVLTYYKNKNRKKNEKKRKEKMKWKNEKLTKR